MMLLVLTDLEKLPLIYGMLFSLPGIPCIYYGSEWGQTGKKEQGSDASLRPEYEKPLPNDLTKYIKKLVEIRNKYKALQLGEYNERILTNKQFVFERVFENQKIIIALNLDENEYTISLNEQKAHSLIDNISIDSLNNVILPPKSIQYYLIEN